MGPTGITGPTGAVTMYNIYITYQTTTGDTTNWFLSSLNASELPASMSAQITDASPNGGTITVTSTNTSVITSSTLYKFQPLVYSKIYAGTTSSLSAWKASPIWTFSPGTAGNPVATLVGSTPTLTFPGGFKVTGGAAGTGALVGVNGDGTAVMLAIISLAFNPSII
jgi:hypothetical protein